MIFEPLIDYLEENISVLKQGSTLFINKMPFEIPLGLMLKDSFSGIEIDGEIPALRRGRFQMAVRGKNYSQVKALAEEASALLTMKEVDLPGMTVKIIRPLTEPVSYQPSVGGNTEFSVNFSAIYGIVAE